MEGSRISKMLLLHKNNGEHWGGGGGSVLNQILNTSGNNSKLVTIRDILVQAGKEKKKKNLNLGKSIIFPFSHPTSEITLKANKQLLYQGEKWQPSSYWK